VERALVAVRVKPGASRTAVGGSYPGRYGPALVVRVSAPAVDGRATAAVLDAVATALRLRRADVSLHQGASSRDKVLAVGYPPDDLAARVAALRDGPDQQV
jgi:uncharacterized protein YggU (UPF0235/DUF167 family)